VSSVLRDQQYMFCERSLLVAEKALLIRNDLAGMLLRRPMPRLPQLMLSHGPTGVSISDIVQHTGISRDSVHRIVRNHLKFWKVSARWVPKQLKPEQQAMRIMSRTCSATRQKGKRCWRGL